MFMKYAHHFALCLFNVMLYFENHSMLVYSELTLVLWLQTILFYGSTYFTVF